MCGRFITPDAAAIEREWGLVAPPDFAQSYNFTPSQFAPVIRVNEVGEFDLSLLTWGFQPGWAKRAWINSRAETLFSSKAFASAARKRRCLVPAIGWFEWKGSKPPRTPYVFHQDGFVPFAFAGIWTARKIEGGGDDEWERSFSIVTTEATGALAEIHHRKPVVLSKSGQRKWLAAEITAEEAAALIAAEVPDVMTYPVSTYVNKPENNDAACIRPAVG